MRSSAYTLAVGYVLLGLVTLALFAAPLWYAWRVTIEDSRTEILQEDTQRFAEVFRQRGAQGLAAFIDERVAMQIAAERLLLLSDPDLEKLAGNLPEWPAEIPAAPGTYTVTMARGGQPVVVRLVRSSLPGGYNLLVGRDQILFQPLEQRFWYGLACRRRALRRRHVRRDPDPARGPDPDGQHQPDRLGDHPGRSRPATADGIRPRRVQHAVADDQPDARPDRAAGPWRAQRLQRHRP